MEDKPRLGGKKVEEVMELMFSNRRWSLDLEARKRNEEKANSEAKQESRKTSMDICSRTVTSTRVERLLKQREMRRTRSSVSLSQDDEKHPLNMCSTPSFKGLPEANEGLGPESPSAKHSIERDGDLEGDGVESEGAQRLLVVANRLPVSAKKLADGSWLLQESAGGLVSALLGIHSHYDCTWIGWPGVFVEPGPDRDRLTKALAQRNCYPVYIDEDMLDLYYNGYCNNVLWPLFHYVPLPLEARLSETKNLQNQWKAYVQTNELFARGIMNLYQENDILWLHDYHVMLLPKMLKEIKPSMKVGWFLHTPFPSSEIYRALPRREEILRGVLKADLIGLHTYDYARHFVSACTRILGLEGTPEGVEDNGQVTRVAAFPIGINPERFTQALETEIVKAHIEELKERFGGRKVMLGVDRLDMIKGIPQKLLAYEMFLDENPSWCDRVLLVQIAVPSRTHVPEYQRLASLVHEMVGRINGRFGTLGSMPIHHLDRSLSFHELCALYALTDVALVTPVRDGMNLVSYEVVACQSKNAGVLVLSEFAGAAQSLGAGAILVNPWNVSDLAAAIEEALTMGDAERRERHRQNFMHVTVHTSQAWADTFVSELNDTHVEAAIRTMRTPPMVEVPEVVSGFKDSQERLIILGYATLCNAVEPTQRRAKRHFDNQKNMSQVHPTVIEALRVIASVPNVTLVIFSGCGRSRLEDEFDGLPVWLAAENGVFLRPPASEEEEEEEELPQWLCTADSMSMDWLESVQLVFDYFCERTPRSFVETRETSLVWNYKYADPEFGMIQARDLLQHLVTGPISNAPVDVIQGQKSVEVRQVGVSKAAAIDRILTATVAHQPHRHSLPPPSTTPVDFVLCVGHFMGRDEDIFTYFEECSEVPGRPAEEAELGRGELDGGILTTATADLIGVESSSRAAARKRGQQLSLDAQESAFLANVVTDGKGRGGAPRPRAHTSGGGAADRSFHPPPHSRRSTINGGSRWELNVSEPPPPGDALPGQPRRHTFGGSLLNSPRELSGEQQALASSSGLLAATLSLPQLLAEGLNLEGGRRLGRAHSDHLAAEWGGHESRPCTPKLRSLSQADDDYAWTRRGSMASNLGSNLNSEKGAKRLMVLKYLYTCTVNRKKSQARYYLSESSDVAELLSALADAMFDGVEHEHRPWAVPYSGRFSRTSSATTFTDAASSVEQAQIWKPTKIMANTIPRSTSMSSCSSYLESCEYPSEQTEQL
eukprot:CAMPEP_0118931200 /NCGR_PEP_ID=MMETSP1169-20130426/7621_1 /TAXON_ID=36882 /ORGANISM="Pyramimonas obovata, Strain CCMP722" /LENGTH=1226 /DNA_ID=CAMNT_0006873671 /DNA_START=433 /DNA_END=4113 /DNA_ORIENTATION=-